MKTKRAAFFLIILLVFFCVPLTAMERIVDRAGLLKPADKKDLLKLINSVSAEYNFDLVIVTEKSIGKVKPKKYADNFFDKNGYGQGKGKDGCLFLQVTGSRDYWFSTSGRGIKILNSTPSDKLPTFTQILYGMEILKPAAFGKLEKDVVACLKDNNPASAYTAFINNWEEFLKLDAQGRVYTSPLNVFWETLWIMSGVAVIMYILVSLFFSAAGSSGSRDSDYDSDYDSGYDSGSSSSDSGSSDSGSHGGGGGRY